MLVEEAAPRHSFCLTLKKRFFHPLFINMAVSGEKLAELFAFLPGRDEYDLPPLKAAALLHFSFVMGKGKNPCFFVHFEPLKQVRGRH